MLLGRQSQSESTLRQSLGQAGENPGEPNQEGHDASCPGSSTFEWGPGKYGEGGWGGGLCRIIRLDGPGV